MGVRSLGAAAAAAVLFVFVPTAHAADTTWTREAQQARAALARSLRAGYLQQADVDRYGGILGYAGGVRRRVPPTRAQLLERVLGQVAEARSPTAPRALELYTTLQENAAYLAAHGAPPGGTDITGQDGAVYRFFAGDGFEFHPLADAGTLNALVAAGNTEAADALVAALAARAVPQPGGALLWEYWFDFGGERAPWTSGMAQAVLAQAFARAGALDLAQQAADLDLARRAYAAIPGSLDFTLPAGTWIRLYSDESLVVLNAQLQSGISIGDYAQLAGDEAAAAYANELLATAKTMLPQFDTGWWSRYSLGVQSDLNHQDYVVSLLKMLGARTGDPAWTDMADRFAEYETQPPALTGGQASRIVYPRPLDGVRDDVVVRFWLSKPSKVLLVVDGAAVDGYAWLGGWHTFSWKAQHLGFGTHRVSLVAHSVDGNTGKADLGSFSVEPDTTPPTLTAGKARGRVFWQAKDPESACCSIRLDLRHGGTRRVLASSQARGSAVIPAGQWSVTVVARDAAGHATTRELGLVSGRG
jgi:D-glucuronyl C5-epimerase C-terminus